MQLHHSKHHQVCVRCASQSFPLHGELIAFQTYVNNLNAAEEKLAEASAKNDVSAIIGLQGALKFNGGGHINHSIFWKNLCSKGDAMGAPDGELAKAIDRDFGSFDAMKEKLSASTVAVQVKSRGSCKF